MSPAFIALIVLWLGIIAYAVFGGADFGAGIWDLFAISKKADKEHRFINHSLGPVWEANHVWLIFLIVGLFNIFPSAFSALVIALFVPFSIVLIGLVLRGAAFVFHNYSTNMQGTPAKWWSYVFSITCFITPFFLGTSAASVASGHLVNASGVANAGSFAPWTSPFALAIGVMAVTLCATLAAIYLAVEAHEAGNKEFADLFRRRAFIAGAITAILGALGLLFSVSEAPILWNGLLDHALPVAIITDVLGLITAGLLLFRRYHLARVSIVAATAFLLGSWGFSQYPYVIPPFYTVTNSANYPSVIVTVLIGILIGVIILIPSFYYLFAVFKLPYPVPGRRKPSPPAKKQDAAQEQAQAVRS